MKITAAQLRRIIKEEVRKSPMRLSEAHSRITEEEMTAWKSGDWGFDSQRDGAKDPQRFLHGFESGNPMDDEGYMIKSRMSDVKEMAETICNLLDEGDQLPAWVQDLVASAHTDLEHVKDYLTGDEKMRSHEKSETSVGVALESRGHRKGMLLEGHARITPEEMSAWMGGDWGYVTEHDGGGPKRSRGIPSDPTSLKDYIIRTYQGHCHDLGCEDVSDPVFKDYVGDQLAGQVDRSVLQAALNMI